MLHYAKAIDVSTWQDNPQTAKRIDWTLPKKNFDVHLVINRATFSTTIDDDFYYNWQEQKKLGYLRGAYGFWDYRNPAISATAQAQTLVNVLQKDTGEFPVVWMDLERPVSTWPSLPSPRSVLSSMREYATVVESGLTGKQCGWYMNASMIVHIMGDSAAWREFKPFIVSRPLWIAAWPDPRYFKVGETAEQYIERWNWKPNLYGQWAKWLLWQYGTPPVGFSMGMESKEIDADYFNGTLQELYDFCNVTSGNTEPPVVEEEENMLKMRVLAYVLNVRNGPGMTYPVVGRMNMDEIITVYDVRGKDSSWVKISPTEEKWCCVENYSGRLLQKEE